MAATRLVTISAAAGETGTTIAWQETLVTNGGIGSITRVRVRKADASSAWQTIHERTSSGAYGNLLVWSPPQVSRTAQISPVV